MTTINDLFAQALTDIADTSWIDVTIAGVDKKGNFSDASIIVAGVETTAPTLEVLDADAASVTHGTAVTVNAITYKVIGKQPNGDGTTLLILSKD